MALHSHDYGSPSGLPLSAVLGAIPSYPRPVIARLIARLIDHLDEQDGDADRELNGDEADTANAEDEEGNYWLPWGQPGCPFSDPGEDSQ